MCAWERHRKCNNVRRACSVWRCFSSPEAGGAAANLLGSSQWLRGRRRSVGRGWHVALAVPVWESCFVDGAK